MNSLEILNYEGPVLQLVKTDTLTLIDQWKKPIAQFRMPGLLAFLNGDISIADSSGKIWNWTRQSNDACADYGAIVNFAVE